MRVGYGYLVCKFEGVVLAGDVLVAWLFVFITLKEFTLTPSRD